MSYDEDVQQTLTIAFDGDALRDGTIEVRELAGSLMALGELFEAANESLNGDRARVAVRIKATGAGSFEISFDVIMSWAKQITHLFAGEDISGALNLITVIGLTTGVATKGVIQALKWLRGRKPDQVIQNKDGTVVLVIERETLVVQRDVVLVLESEKARNAVAAFVAPLHRPGIDTLEVRDRTKPQAETEIIATKADIAAIEAQFESEQQLTIQNDFRAALTVLTVSFQERNKWRLSDGDHSFWATVQDEGFLKQIDEHRVSFGKDDVLVCKVHRKQSQTSQGLKSEYTIAEVLEHHHAMRQLQLLPRDDKGSDGEG